MKLTVPEMSLVLLIGPSGSGKSTFARRHFKATEVISSDFCRALVCDDENDQSVTADAFAVLHFIAEKRMSAGRLTVIDATNVQMEARRPLIALARKLHFLTVAIVFDLPEKLCLERNRTRADRDFGPHVVRNQCRQLQRSLRGLAREGFRYVYTLSSPEEVDSAVVERQKLWNDLRLEHGPFDIIGDIHGCCGELEQLLGRLGYEVAAHNPGYGLAAGPVYRHPQGRKAIFLGDLVDRGPRILDTLRVVRNMVVGGTALCVPGNHDIKLMRKLLGKNVQITHGLEKSLAEIEALPESERGKFSQDVADFIDSLVSHYLLDEGRLVVAHAGMKEALQGRGSGKVRDFALYGETTGETDEYGLPRRYNWAAEYRGRATVVYGHTPVPEPEWLNNTINIDTGCVYGGRLTALRYPEKEIVSVAAAETYYQSVKPFLPPAPDRLSAQHEHDELLDLADITGKRVIETRLVRNVTIREENGCAALEVMSRFAANPKWLIYLPPTMSPSETSAQPGLLEHPAEAFNYFLNQGVTHVVCEEKHMGSRAVLIVCRDGRAARDRFGVLEEPAGICYTRTGRRFFNNPNIESELIDTVRAALTAADLWHEFNTDWVCLDCELLPWSLKAQELIRSQYAAVGTAARVTLAAATELLNQALAHGIDCSDLVERYSVRTAMVAQYAEAYRRYCWPVNSISDIRVAPFHLLATEGAVHTDKDHVWHMETLARLCRQQADENEMLLATPYRLIDVGDEQSVRAGIEWWQELTAQGGEGMVVKPRDFIVRGARGLVQPAVKCRGREYLRIIYGPEYTAPEHLERLRARGLAAKRSLAVREFALGIEALERFVRREPLRRVHECVFGIMALESEPVDPRL